MRSAAPEAATLGMSAAAVVGSSLLWRSRNAISREEGSWESTLAALEKTDGLARQLPMLRRSPPSASLIAAAMASRAWSISSGGSAGGANK